MTPYFNLNNNEISKELLVNKFNMILDKQCRHVLNDQKIILPLNEAQRSPVFVQKQPPEVFCKKRCSCKFRKFHKKASVLESPFHKVAGLRDCNVIKKKTPTLVFLVKFAKL